MKRAKATKKEKMEIYSWLSFSGEHQERMCPFMRGCHAPIANYQLYCQKFFPKMTQEGCPCTQFSLSYVKRVAKQLLDV